MYHDQDIYFILVFCCKAETNIAELVPSVFFSVHKTSEDIGKLSKAHQRLFEVATGHHLLYNLSMLYNNYFVFYFLDSYQMVSWRL